MKYSIAQATSLHWLEAVKWLAALMVLAGPPGCSKQDDPSPAAGNKDSEPSPVFGMARELAEPESRSCERTESLNDVEAFVAAVGKTPQDIASDTDIAYETMMRWDTLGPPFGNLAGEEFLEVSVAYQGTARLYPGCGNLVELDMQLVLQARSGALSVNSPATLLYMHPDGYRLQSSLPPESLEEWTAELQGTALHEPLDFEIDIDLSPPGAGTFTVRGPEGARCQLASWPAQRRCEVGERAVLATETYFDLRTQHVIEGAQAIEKSYQILWEDTGTIAEMTVDFVPDDSGLGCILPAGADLDGKQQVRYSVPGAVHLVTNDGRLDVRLPTRARTRGSEGEWSSIDLLTPAVVASERGFGIVPGSDGSDPQRRAVLSFSSPQEPITPRSTRLRGGVEVQTVELNSPQVNPVPSSCIAGEFMGRVSPVVTSASYVARP